MSGIWGRTGTGYSGAGRVIANAAVGSKVQRLAHVRTGKVLNRAELTEEEDECSRGKASAWVAPFLPFVDHVLVVVFFCKIKQKKLKKFFFFVFGPVKVLIQKCKEQKNPEC